MAINPKSILLTKILKINKSGYKAKSIPPLSALKKRTVVFESKKHEVSLSELRSRIADLKKEHRELKERKLEQLMFESEHKYLPELNAESISKKAKIAKLEILMNLILQQELIASTPALKPKYTRIIKRIYADVDLLFSDKQPSTGDKKYIYYSRILKEFTDNLRIRNEANRLRLFNHIEKNLLNENVNQLNLNF